MSAVALDALQDAAHLVGRVAVDAVEDQLGVAENGVERRAQLVTHIGKKLRLVLARLRELPALVLDLAEQPHVLDGDCRLVGKGRDQIDLFVGEWSHSGGCAVRKRHGELLLARESLLTRRAIPSYS